MPDQFMLIVARYRNTFMNVRNEFDNAEKCFAAPPERNTVLEFLSPDF